MKTKPILLAAATALTLFNLQAVAQSFSSGSDGSMGALNVTVTTNLDLPPDGIFKFTTVTVAAGATLRFNRNPMNTPVYLLATGDVLISGNIDVSGSGGGIGPSVNGGAGGPGGFDGGAAGGDGQGPGGGRAGVDGTGNTTNGAGGGSYPTVDRDSFSTNKGSTYGSPLLVPLVGGSGGGGSSSGGGGGGGGAILIASDTLIRLVAPGSINSREGNAGWAANPGSAGAIRLVAPRVEGNGPLGFASGTVGAGSGRARIDTIDRTGLALTANSGGLPISVGAFMTVFPPNGPRLDILAAAGTAIPEGTSAPVTVTLPFGSDTNRTITVQARNFNAVVPIEVVLTPNIGPSQKITAQIDNVSANPATVTVPVAFPVNTPVAVNAWVR